MDLVRARQAFYPLTELCPAPLILNFWCLQLVIAELILCDKAVPAANEFLFPAWGQLSFSSILQGRTVSWRSQIIWPILNMTKCSLLEWLFPTERVLYQVEPGGNNAMKSLVYSWSFFSVLDSDLSVTLVSRGLQKSDQVHSQRALLGWFPSYDAHLFVTLKPEVIFPFKIRKLSCSWTTWLSELKPGCTF